MAQHEPEPEEPECKVFNDPIHGHMKLHPLLVKIIDTPQFQRLRNIKQLGGAYYVYPGASHNRFEHSIGVSHLAGQLVKDLKERQPELNISPSDILCVQIAGLCHDLGHGPFSHLFDGMFLPEARGDKKKIWKHEEASLAMFDHLVEVNNLKPLMTTTYGLDCDSEASEDLTFIKELINGPLDGEPADSPEWPYKGRTKKKSFLYDIVSNKTNGIDVDKFDYFARDSYHLGIKINFDHKRFFSLARVCEADGQRRICMRDKEVENLYDLFHTRYGLHRRAYQHREVNIVQIMIKDAFLKADEHIKSSNESSSLSGAIDDPVAYTKLTDHVFEQILYSSDDELKEARMILENIQKRSFYKFLGETRPRDPAIEQSNKKGTTERWKAELKKGLPGNLQLDDFVVDVIEMNYGMKDKNPIEHVWFYSKEDVSKAFKLASAKISKFVPAQFSEQLTRVYYKKMDDDESVKSAKEHYDKCCVNLKQERTDGGQNAAVGGRENAD